MTQKMNNQQTMTEKVDRLLSSKPVMITALVAFSACVIHDAIIQNKEILAPEKPKPVQPQKISPKKEIRPKVDTVHLM